MAGPLGAIRRRHVWLLAPFIALLAPLSRTISDNSFLWHVRAGTVQLERGEVLRTDPFTFTAGGESWRTQSWMAELGYGWLETTLGGVAWSKMLVLIALLATGLLIALRGSRLGARLPVLVGLGLLFVFQAFSFAVPRPVLLTYPLLAAVALLVDVDEAELWLVPPLVWLWASLHGSFVLGLGLLVLDAMRRRSAARFAVTAVAAVAASLSAHGFAVWQILMDFLSSRETLDLIEEWSRPSPGDLRAAPFFILVAVALVLAVMRRFTVAELIVVIPFLLFGLAAVRNMLPAVIVAGPVVAAAVSRAVPATWERTAPRSEDALVNAALVLVVVGALVAVAARPHRLDAQRFPGPEIVAALGPGPVAHDDAVGGYLIWRVGPGRLVFIDDRAELHGADAYRTMASILSGEHALEQLEALGIDQVLVSVDEPVVAVLDEAGWVERAGDGWFVVMTATL